MSPLLPPPFPTGTTGTLCHHIRRYSLLFLFSRFNKSILYLFRGDMTLMYPDPSFYLFRLWFLLRLSQIFMYISDLI